MERSTLRSLKLLRTQRISSTNIKTGITREELLRLSKDSETYKAKSHRNEMGDQAIWRHLQQ